MKLYSILEGLLNLNEEKLKENTSANELAELLHISSIHGIYCRVEWFTPVYEK